MPKPQGAITMTSGSAATRSCQAIDVERSPAAPNNADAPGQLDQLRSPVAHREQRVDPLEARDLRMWQGPRPIGQRGQPRPDVLDQFLTRLGDAQQPRDAREGIEDPIDGPRLQRHHAAPLKFGGQVVRQIRGADGADLAVGLRDDHVGLQAGQQRFVDLVQGRAGPQALAHARVDLAAGSLDVERRAAERRQTLHPGRGVAFVRSADQAIADPQRAHQLRAARQQGDDPLGRVRFHAAILQNPP